MSVERAADVELAGIAMADLVSRMVKALVDAPDAADVQLTWQNECAVLNITAAPEDVGKVIGRNGYTARALRLIAQGASSKLKLRCELNIVAAPEHSGGPIWGK